MGEGITRRGFFGHAAGAYAATAIVGGIAVARSDLHNIRLMQSYNEWLHMERRLLMMEAFPDEDDRLVHAGTAAATFHLPERGTWRSLPQPSTRASLILGSLGIVV